MWEKQAHRDALAAIRWNTVTSAGIKTIVAVAIPALAARGAQATFAPGSVLAVVRHPRRLSAGFAACAQELGLMADGPAAPVA